MPNINWKDCIYVCLQTWTTLGSEALIRMPKTMLERLHLPNVNIEFWDLN